MAKDKAAIGSSALKGVKGQAKVALKQLAANGGKVQVVGSIVNGKLQIDQANLNEIASKFPNARLSFIAVNAPFDPIRA